MTTVKGRNGQKVRVPWTQSHWAGVVSLAVALTTVAVIGFALHRMGQL